MEKLFIELFKTDKWRKGEKDETYYYMFETSPQTAAEKGVVYWVLYFNNKDNYEKKLAGERDVTADGIIGIKEKPGENGIWYSGMKFDNENKKAFYVNLYDNNMKDPAKQYDKLLVMKEAEYREPKVKPTLDEEFGWDEKAA